MNLEETLHDLLNNVNIKMVSSNDPFEQELLKSFGKFKENFSNSIKKTMDSNQPTFTQVRNDIPSISPIETKLEMQPPKKKFTPWFIFKIVLGITIFGLLALNIFTYFKTGTDAFTHFIGNCHIYDDHIDALKNQLIIANKEGFYDFPTLDILENKENIDDYKFQDFKINNYKYNKKIKMNMRA